MTTFIISSWTVNNSIHAVMHSKQKSYERTSNVGLQMYEIHWIYLDNFSNRDPPENRQFRREKPRFRRRTVFGKNLGFGGGFGYRNNTTKYSLLCRNDPVHSNSTDKGQLNKVSSWQDETLLARRGVLQTTSESVTSLALTLHCVGEPVIRCSRRP